MFRLKKVTTARYYAHIRSYIETCYRNGINVVYALECLCKGKPFSLTQILNKDADPQKVCVFNVFILHSRE